MVALFWIDNVATEMTASSHRKSTRMVSPPKFYWQTILYWKYNRTFSSISTLDSFVIVLEASLR
jgi:hypothetical protein